MNFISLSEEHNQEWKNLIVGGILLLGISELHKLYAVFFLQVLTFWPEVVMYKIPLQ